MSEEKSDSAGLTNESIQDYEGFKQQQETIAQKYAEFVSNRGPNYHQPVEAPSHRYTTTWRQHQRELSDRHFRDRQHLHRLEGRYPDNLQGGTVDEQDIGSFWEQLKRFLKWW